MTNLSVFNFESHKVRSTGTPMEPWFVGLDICEVLSINNSRDALERLDEDEKDVVSIDTPGGKQMMTVINESGLYSLVLTSRKPQAKRFKKWLTSEVIPTIRRTGTYSVPQVAPQQQPPVKALPSEYDIKLKALKSEQSVILTEIEAARQKIQELQKQHDTVRLKLAKLIVSKTKQAALEYKEALAVISELEAVSKEEQDAMYARVFCAKDK